MLAHSSKALCSQHGYARYGVLSSCGGTHPAQVTHLRSRFPAGSYERAVLQTPVMTRCTRLVFDDTRIITGSLNGTVVVLDIQ